MNIWLNRKHAKHAVRPTALALPLPWLVDVLGQYDGAHFALDRLDA